MHGLVLKLDTPNLSYAVLKQLAIYIIITCFALVHAVPANLDAPLVEAVSDTSLSVTFTEPVEPNGVIVIYTIYL